jgi:hypothetical protein
MITNISIVQPNTPTWIRGDLQGTDVYPYVLDGQMALVPRNLSIRELGDAIRNLCGKLTVADKDGLREIKCITSTFLALLSGTDMRYICIYNLKPAYSAALCFYLTGEFPRMNVALIETILQLPECSIGSRNKAYSYADKIREMAEKWIQSEEKVC